jgi:signal transduction histidine kinase
LWCDAVTIVGQQLSDLIQGAVPEAASVAGTLAAPAGRSACCEVVCRSADGSTFPAQLRAHRFEHRGATWTVAALRDTTADRLAKETLQRYIDQLVMAKEALQHYSTDLEQLVQARTEELCVAKETADRASAAKSEFLANMSHELRTPLHAILSFARFGVGKHETAERAKLLTFFQRIETTGQTLLGLLNELLDLSKLEAGAVELECEWRPWSRRPPRNSPLCSAKSAWS